MALQEKQALLQEYNDIMRKRSDKIVSTRARYADSIKEVIFVNSDGSAVVEERPQTTLFLMATAREGDMNIQSAYKDIGLAALNNNRTSHPPTGSSRRATRACMGS